MNPEDYEIAETEDFEANNTPPTRLYHIVVDGGQEYDLEGYLMLSPTWAMVGQGPVRQGRIIFATAAINIVSIFERQPAAAFNA